MRWGLLKYLSVIVLLLGLDVFSQTVHKDDLGYFVGAFKQVSFLDDTPWRHKMWRIDPGGFVDGRIVRPDSNGRYDYSFVTRDTLYRWVYDWDHLETQKGNDYLFKFNQNVDFTYRFYFFMDLNGFEMMQNVLTVWRDKGNDSLTFVSVQDSLFYSSMGPTLNEFTVVLPGDTVFLVALKRGGDDDSWWGSYNFYMSDSLFQFTEFYKISWDFNTRLKNFNNISYDFDNFDISNQLLEQKVTYFHYNEESYDANIGDFINPVEIVDSIVIDTLKIMDLIQAYDSHR